MKITWRSELPSLLILAVMGAASVWAAPLLPDRVPVHYGLDFEPDRWGRPLELLVATPIVAVVMYLLCLALPRIDPGRENYEAFDASYQTIRISLLGFLAVVHIGILVSARGGGPDVRSFVFPSFGVLWIVIGSLMGKLRPNWFVGMRTPWTLSSRKAWGRANRAAGWVLIAVGVLYLVFSVVREPWAFWAPLAVLVVGVIVVTVDSYFIWKADPDKVPPAGTTPATGG